MTETTTPRPPKTHNGFEMISTFRYRHPSDGHIWGWLGRDPETGETVYWTHSTENGGFFWGHYSANGEKPEDIFFEKWGHYGPKSEDN